MCCHEQASREHYCVNKAVNTKANKEEECEKLLRGDGPSCQFYSNVNKLHGVHAMQSLKARMSLLQILASHVHEDMEHVAYKGLRCIKQAKQAANCNNTFMQYMLPIQNRVGIAL